MAAGRMSRTIRIVLPDEEDDFLGGGARRRIDEEVAVNIIQRCWGTHIRKRLFKLLKHTIRAAEHCISYDILKRIFCKSAKQGNQYISGKAVITSTSEAAVDACKLMGYRKYYNQMLWDEIQYKKYGIIDQMDVATIRDYVQYVSHMDETPAYVGGRHNYWRKLSLENFPRTMIMYDIMDYAQSRKMSERLRLELPFLLLRPQNEETSRAQLLAVCQIRSPAPCPTTACLSKANRMSVRRISERRSYQARRKNAKLRKAYRTKKEEEEELDHTFSSDRSGSDHSLAENESLFSDEDWEQEAVRLYDWARSLRTEDI